MTNLQMAEKPVAREDGALDIEECFLTIQGEGPFAGRVAVFVRTAGCNLQCPLCFGTKIKSRIPYLSRVIGDKVRLDEVQEGERILTFDENLQLVETEITSLVKRKVKLWVQLVIAGKTYDVTLDHPFFTNRGLVVAHELVVGDEILEARPNEIIAYKKMGDRNPMKVPEVARRSADNTDYRKVAISISETRKRKFLSGELRPSFYSLTPEQQEVCRRKHSEAKRREKNPNWKGVCPNLLDVQEAIDKGGYLHCERCSKSGQRLLVHHDDGDHDNDNRENLKVWCHRCHNQHHERGYNFWNGKRSDGKELIKAHNGQTVEKVGWRKGNLPVLNISCAPYNTYLANGMWVHNCDTIYASPLRRLVECGSLLAEVIHRANGIATLVVLTGGEPLRQRCGPFVRSLIANGFEVQIETNGTLWDESLRSIRHDLTIVCSPKASINMVLMPRISALKYVLREGAIDPIDGLPTSALDSQARPGRPWFGFDGEVYVQPCDEGDADRNKQNTAAAVASCMKFGYRLAIQCHKIAGVP